MKSKIKRVKGARGSVLDHIYYYRDDETLDYEEDINNRSGKIEAARWYATDGVSIRKEEFYNQDGTCRTRHLYDSRGNIEYTWRERNITLRGAKDWIMNIKINKWTWLFYWILPWTVLFPILLAKGVGDAINRAGWLNSIFLLAGVTLLIAIALQVIIYVGNKKNDKLQSKKQ